MFFCSRLNGGIDPNFPHICKGEAPACVELQASSYTLPQARFLADIRWETYIIRQIVSLTNTQNSFAMETQRLSVPYKNDRYDVDVSVEHKSEQCRIKARVVGHELLFVSTEGDCLRAVYREEIIADGLIREIAKTICKECL